MKGNMYKWVPWISLTLVAIILTYAFLNQGNPPLFSTKQTLGTGGNGAIADFNVFDESARVAAPTTSSFYDGDYYEPAPEGKQFVIRNGYLSIIVQHADATAEALQDVAKKYGGAVTNRSLSQSEGITSGYVTLTVEESQFDTAVNEIKALALVVESESVSADDVTETVIDIEARLGNARAEETRYLEILQQAQSVEDILLVEQNLSRVRGTIESFEAQLEYYTQKTSFSNITVFLTEETSIEIGGVEFRPGQAVIDAAQTVVELVQQLIIALIYVVIVGGAVLIPALLIYKGVRAHKKSKR